MTELTDDVAPAEWPDSVVRNNFPFDDYKVVSGNWTAWDEPTRRAFADLVASTRPSDAAAAIAGFLTSNDPSRPAEQPEPEPPSSPAAPAPESVVVPDPGPVVAQNEPPRADPPAAAPDSPGGGQQPDGAGHEDHVERVYAALRTGATAKAWAEQHPEDVKAMIAYEAGEDGKGRKSVLATLRGLQEKSAVE